MSKYTVVKSAPDNLEDGCIVITGPSFLNEIKTCLKKKPRSNALSVNYLREIVAHIGLQYGPETFNPMSDVNVTQYRGVGIESDEKTNEVLIDLFSKQYPAILEGYVDHHIKSRPRGTRLIYFTGNSKYGDVFTRNGLDNISPKDIDVYLGKKAKKTVGKPAITNEEAKNHTAV